jgi:hypothetical protein
MNLSLLREHYLNMGFDIDKLLERAFKGELIETEAISLMCSRLKDIFI